jgi:hypothetical protein
MSWGFKVWLPSIPSMSIYGGTQKTKLPLLTPEGYKSLKGEFGSLQFSSLDGCLVTATCLASTQAL